jgi:aspartate/methionine/tyrosine aminotransferase
LKEGKGMVSYDVCYPGQDMSENLLPRYNDAVKERIGIFGVNKREVWPSKMFTIKLELEEFKRENPDVEIYDASQGDGGMSLGGIPREELAEALIRYLPKERTTKYGDPIGNIELRKKIYENYYRFDEDTKLSPDNIIIGDGGRDVLQKWYQAIQQTAGRYGDVILVSAAPWGSYPEAPYINGLNVMSAPGDPNNAFKITPEGIDISIEYAAKDDRKIIGLIITSPDNPTGNYMQPEEMIHLIEHAISKGIEFIFVDLMYQAVTDLDVGCYDLNKMYKLLSKKAKERVCFMDGLTKKAGASNLRNAHLVSGSKEIANKIKGIATHTVIPNAIGEAAAYEIYRQDNPIKHPWIQRVIVPTAESRKIVKEKFKEYGFKFICDQGYYAFVNIYPWLGKKIPPGKELIESNGNKIDKIENVEILKSYLAKKCGLAVIHGTVFKQKDFIRFSYANAPNYTLGSINRFYESLKELR